MSLSRVLSSWKTSSLQSKVFSEEPFFFLLFFFLSVSGLELKSCLNEMFSFVARFA